MKVTINTEVLRKEHLSLGEFLILLLGFYDVDYEKSCSKLVESGLVSPNLFCKTAPVLSNNTKDTVARLLMSSEEKAIKSGINFEELAEKLCAIFPDGIKPGTTYHWRSTPKVIAQKLRTLVIKYDFLFTEEEATAATREYVESFKDYKYMQLLRYFILKTSEENGDRIISSPFMTIIENNRAYYENNNR